MAGRTYVKFAPGLLEVIEEFQREEFCLDRNEAINRMVAYSVKQWKADRQAQAS